MPRCQLTVLLLAAVSLICGTAVATEEVSIDVNESLCKSLDAAFQAVNPNVPSLMDSYMYSTLNVQYYYGGCFAVPERKIPVTGTLRPDALLALQSTIAAYGMPEPTLNQLIAWAQASTETGAATQAVVPLNVLYSVARTYLATNNIATVTATVERNMTGEDLTRSLASGALPIVVYQSLTSTTETRWEGGRKVYAGYPNVINSPYYSVVVGLDHDWVYLVDTRDDSTTVATDASFLPGAYRIVNRTKFLTQRWKAMQSPAEGGAPVMCTRCALLVAPTKAPAGATGDKKTYVLDRLSVCPEAQPLL